MKFSELFLKMKYQFIFINLFPENGDPRPQLFIIYIVFIAPNYICGYFLLLWKITQKIGGRVEFKEFKMSSMTTN